MGKSIFARAAAGLNLTPAERAALRLVEGLAATFVVAAITVAAPMLAGGSVNWQTVAHAAIAAGVTAALLAILKYARAFGDPPLPSGGIVQSFTMPIMASGPTPANEAVVLPATPIGTTAPAPAPQSPAPQA